MGPVSTQTAKNIGQRRILKCRFWFLVMFDERISYHCKLLGRSSKHPVNVSEWTVLVSGVVEVITAIFSTGSRFEFLAAVGLCYLFEARICKLAHPNFHQYNSRCERRSRHRHRFPFIVCSFASSVWNTATHLKSKSQKWMNDPLTLGPKLCVRQWCSWHRNERTRCKYLQAANRAFFWNFSNYVLGEVLANFDSWSNALGPARPLLRSEQQDGAVQGVYRTYTATWVWCWLTSKTRLTTDRLPNPIWSSNLHMSSELTLLLYVTFV